MATTRRREAPAVPATNPEAEATVQAAPPAPAFSLKVKVRADALGMLRVELLPPSERLPTMAEIRPHLPRECARGIPDIDWRRGYSIREFHHIHPLPNDVWARAIGAACVVRAANQRPVVFDPVAESTALNDLCRGYSYLSVGSYLYRLVPTGVIPANKALATTRAKMHASVAAEKARLLESAQAEAQIVLQQAKEVRRQAEEARVELTRNARMTIPRWLAGAQLRFQPDYPTYPLLVRWPIDGYDYPTFRFRAFTYQLEVPPFTRFTWRMTSDYAVSVQLRIPITPAGEYDPAGITAHTMDGGSICLPHISSNRTCLQPQGIPRLLRSITDLLYVVNLLCRAHSEVNLNSLLTDPRDWPQELREMLPDAIRRGRWSMDEEQERDGVERTPTPARGQVWSLDDPPPIAPVEEARNG